MKKKNVCFFNTTKKWGGGEKWHYKASRYLSENNYNVFMITNKNSELFEKVNKDKIKIKEVEVGNLSFLNVLKIIKLVKFLRKNQIKTVIMNLPSDVKIGGIASKLAGVEKILYRRGMPHPIKNTFLNRFIFGKLVTGVIANSKEIKKSIIKNNKELIDESKLHVLYNGVDIEEYEAREFNKIYEKTNDEIVLGNAGRLVDQKNQLFLIKIAKKLKDKNYKFKLIIAGKGPLEDAIKKEISKYNLDKEIILAGFKSNIKDLFESVDIFLFPSKFEGSANTLVEAGMAKKPMIAFDISSMPELVLDGENGYLAEFENIDSFFEKTEKLILDTEIRKKMSECAYQTVKDNYRNETIFKQFEEIL